jgi:hypothetical protein
VDGISQQAAMYFFMSDYTGLAFSGESLPIGLDEADFSNGLGSIEVYTEFGGFGIAFSIDALQYGQKSELELKSVNWNPAIGGLDFAYTVQGKLETATTAKVFWASGTTYQPVEIGSVFSGRRQ